jgi:hypothetical protein
VRKHGTDGTFSFWKTFRLSPNFPTLNQLANEAAQEFRGKHPYAIKSPEQAQAMNKYIADNKLSPWEPKDHQRPLAASRLKSVTDVVRTLCNACRETEHLKA